MTTPTPPIPGMPVDLPDLPDVEQLRQAAQQRLEHFTQERDRAQGEIDRAVAFLAQTGKAPHVRKPAARRNGKPPVSEELYRQALTALGNHEYAGLGTIAQEAGCSKSHAAVVMGLAVERRHATKEVRARGTHRYRITEQGMEVVCT